MLTESQRKEASRVDNVAPVASASLYFWGGRRNMAKITYVEHNGTEHVIDVKTGVSIMEGAVKNNVPGIDADCGGACSCATCHVYVDEAWLAVTGEPSAMEVSMLDFAEEIQPNSRLSCQIKVSDQMDGVVVRLPKAQH
jgi:2Fe-2S ferredoxin